MATFKAEVYAHQKKKDGTYNIKIRVTHNGEKRYLATPYFIYKEDITQKTFKIKNQHYIDLTDEMIRTYRKRLDRWGERQTSMTMEQIIRIITTDNENEKFDLDIAAYTWKEIKRMKEAGHGGNADTYICAVRSLVKFVGREKVMLSEITAKFLQNWADWINKQPNVTRGYVTHNYLNRMRAIYNRAKKEFNDEDAGVIRIPYSPFSHIDFPKLPATRKRALTVEQIQAIATLEYTKILQPGTNRFNFAKDVFLLSFGLIGMNAIDLYNCTDYRNGRITYQRIKTKERRIDKAEISIKVEPEYQALVDKYRDPTGKRVFRFYTMYADVNTFSTALNKGLKKVGKLVGVDDLEFYAARHSWATIALNDAGVDKYTVHTSLNHVDDSMRVTDIYIKKSWDPIDQANRKVINLVNINISETKEPINEKVQRKLFCLSNLLRQNEDDTTVHQ